MSTLANHAKIMADSLLEIKTFSSDYWGTETQFKVESFLDSCNKLDISKYMESLDVKSSWIPYFKSYFQEQTLELLQESANLGNPYAAIEIYDQCRWSNPDIANKYLKIAYDLNTPTAIVKSAENRIDKYNIHWDMREIKELNDEVVTDLRKIKECVFARRVFLGDAMIRIYEELNRINCNNRYMDEIIFLRNNTIHENKWNRLQTYREDVYTVINSNYYNKIRNERLEKENKELKAAYEELKKLKELDFNNLISNGVGSYLN